MNLVRVRVFVTLVLTAILGSVAGLYLGAQLTGASAAQASNYGTVSISSDSFRNYDHKSQSASSSNVDWAITMLFWNNAEVDIVKQQFFQFGYSMSGSPKYAYLQDNGYWVWDVDSGIKQNFCTTYHMRVYADSDDQMYNPSWGYYVLGTTHKDVNHGTFCGGTEQFGWSEEAEEAFAQHARDAGLAVAEDWVNMQNNEPPHWDTIESNHYWSNNAYATRVYMP